METMENIPYIHWHYNKSEKQNRKLSKYWKREKFI
jgi:hypothetical protein